MEEQVSKNKVLSSLMWKYLERGSVQGISFLVSIILARLLTPEDYGIIVILTVFINFANVFIQSGFSMALIRKTTVDEEEYSTVFYISLAISFFLYMILYCCAPLIADFYANDKIVKVIRVLAIILPFGALNSIQNAILIREMEFKKIFRNGLVAVIVSGTVGIAIAFAGGGVWALVSQQISNIVCVCVIMWFTVKWRPKIVFSVKKIRDLFSFGWKILLSSLIDTTYDQLYNLVVGKLYSSDQLAYFNKGQEFPRFIVINIDSSIESVMLPLYAQYQNELLVLKSVLRKAITISSYIVFPILCGLLATAEAIVEIILTDKWLASVPFVQIYCLALLFHPINIANTQAINAMGKSEVTLKINICKKILAIVVLVCSIKFGIYGIAFGAIINGIIFVILNVMPNKKLLNYGIKEQMMDIFPALSMSVVMGLIVYSISYLNIDIYAKLLLQVSVGVWVYVFLSWLTANKTYFYLKKMLKEILRGTKHVAE